MKRTPLKRKTWMRKVRKEVEYKHVEVSVDAPTTQTAYGERTVPRQYKPLRLETRTCSRCEVGFTTRNKSKKYCSPACFYASVRESERGPVGKLRACKKCNALYRSVHPKKFCSWACVRSASERDRLCLGCGKSFVVPIPSDPKRFCSVLCGIKSRHPDIEITCGVCGKISRQIKYGSKKFCSPECLKIGRSGERNSLYRGNRRQDRGSDWKQQSAAARLRDGHICHCCKTPGTQKLSVDHIVPYRLAKAWFEDFPLGPSPNDLTNLVSLCRACHSKKTHAERCLLVGDVIGFRSKTRSIIDPQLVENAMRLFGVA